MDSVTKYLNAGALEPSGFCCCFVGGFVCFGSGNLGFLNIVLELAEFTGSYENIDSLLLLSPNFVPGTPHRGDGVGGKLAYHTSTLPFNVLLFLAFPPPQVEQGPLFISRCEEPLSRQMGQMGQMGLSMLGSRGESSPPPDPRLH